MRLQSRGAEVVVERLVREGPEREPLAARPRSARLVEHPDYDLAAPTPDHFIPALYFAGLAAADETKPNVLIDGYLAGSLSMTAYGLDGHCPTSTEADGGAAALPDVPADQANV